MLSLDFLDKVANRVNFHSITIILLYCLAMIKVHSTSFDSLDKGAIRFDFAFDFLLSKNSNRLARALHAVE